MTPRQLYVLIVACVIVILMGLGAAVFGAVESALAPNTLPQGLQNCIETCRPNSVHEFNTDGNGNSVCICSD